MKGFWVVVAVSIAACGAPISGSGGVPPASSATTEAVATLSSSTTTAADPERPIAPEFSLQMGDGGTFTLSEETRPVYLVFWAEW